MKQVYILRHAKSSWDNKDLSDFDRPLSKRGEKDAKKMCSFIKNKNFFVDKVICSSAKRTKETFDLIADGLNFAIEEASYTEDLYFGDTENIINYLNRLDEKLNNI
jgi:Phosphohistidine phosphatase SixA